MIVLAMLLGLGGMAIAGWYAPPVDYSPEVDKCKIQYSGKKLDACLNSIKPCGKLHSSLYSACQNTYVALSPLTS